MNQRAEDERKAFESYIRSLPHWKQFLAEHGSKWGFERSKEIPNMYYNQRLDDMWKGWQAAQAVLPAGEAMKKGKR